jgi:hypothetical protein
MTWRLSEWPLLSAIPSQRIDWGGTLPDAPFYWGNVTAIEPAA